ncbi:MAG: acyltransferase family protein [Methanoregula sp.]|nr:MAG: acyltransferase family protein [Methanoregula sp.]
MKKQKSTKDNVATVTGHLPEHLTQIDLLKGYAIIAVVFLHVWKESIYLLLGAPFHIWHAVPLLILIAGFTGAYAYKRRGASTLGQCFDLTILSRRFKRLLKPYALYWLIQIILLIVFFHSQFNLLSLMSNFIWGGSGWGAYFVPVILQSVIVIPLLYLFALRNPDLMIILAFVLGMLMDFFMFIFGVPRSISSVLYLPYLFAGALGVWMVTSTKRPRIWIIFGCVFSFTYLLMVCYTPLLSSFTDFNAYNGMFHTPAYFWTLLLAISGLYFLPKKTETRIYRMVENAGKASWHIFLVQMFYFLFIDKIILKYIIYPLSDLLPLTDLFVIVIHIAGALFAIGICCIIGYCWFIIENKWSYSHLKIN